MKSTIERVSAKLEGKHWMYKGSAQRLDVIKMCEDCRVAAMTEQDFNPYGAPDRPNPRTTDDYLRERDNKPAAESLLLRTAARCREKSTSALRSCAEPICCSGIFVPGV